jgi:ribosomal protein S6
LRQHNGEISVEPRAKRLTLAYEIKKHKEAVFAYCTFKAAGEDAKKLEQDLTTNTEVIRFLIIKTPKPDLSAERRTFSPAESVTQRRTRTMRPGSTPSADAKPVAPKPLSNEALEKKIEEILQ